jgi:ankyrin repeat protein
VVQVLLDAQASLGATNKSDLTALHHAASGGHAKTVQLLLDAGAAVGVATAHGQTALHVAACAGHIAVLQVLLDAHAAVDAADAQGNTALHMAAHKGHTAVVQLLLDAGADITAGNVQGSTPPQHAAEGRHTQAVQLRLAAPRVTLEDMTGAAKAAATAGHAELAHVVLGAVIARDMAAAAPLLEEQALAAQVLKQWQAAEANVREQEARWPALQQLLVGIAGAHQQLQAASAGVDAAAQPIEGTRERTRAAQSVASATQPCVTSVDTETLGRPTKRAKFSGGDKSFRKAG